MAITQTKTWTRASTRTPFWVTNDLTKEYIKKNYIDTGKILDLRRVEDASGHLSVSLTTVFASMDTRQEFLSDPIMEEHNRQRDGHNQYHNISEETTIESD
jgi:hypothetical protein